MTVSFAAEMLVGLWRTYASLDPTITPAGITHLPSPSRMMMPHVPAGKWNDYAKMNSFLFRAIFPAMSFEYQNDFLDRTDTQRAFVFDRVVFADRAAAFRGPEFQRTWRTSSEAITLQASRYWWAPVRKNLLDFVGGVGEEGYKEYGQEGWSVGMEVEPNPVDEEDVEALEAEEEALKGATNGRLKDVEVEKGRKKGKPVVTYVSRQEWGRRMLIKEDHEEFVKELEELERKYGWEVGCRSPQLVCLGHVAHCTGQHRFNGQAISRRANPISCANNRKFLIVTRQPLFLQCRAVLMPDYDWRARKWPDSLTMDEQPKPPLDRH